MTYTVESELDESKLKIGASVAMVAVNGKKEYKWELGVISNLEEAGRIWARIKERATPSRSTRHARWHCYTLSLHMSLHISLYTCRYICRYTHVAIHVTTHAATYVATHVATYVATHVATHAATYVATHVATYVATHVATHVATYVATHATTHVATCRYTHIATHGHGHVHVLNVLPLASLHQARNNREYAVTPLDKKVENYGKLYFFAEKMPPSPTF
jgi:hypothetical protein